MPAVRAIPLIASHLVVLGLTYAIVHAIRPTAEVRAESANVRTSPTNRMRDGSPQTGEALLAHFRSDLSRKKSRYEELKESLQPADDLKAAALAAIQHWGNATSDADRQEAEATIRVRFYHWLRSSPREVMLALAGEEIALQRLPPQLLVQWLRADAFSAVAREQGIMKSLDWLPLHHSTLQAFVAVLSEEMKQGGGMALFLQVEQALLESAPLWLNGPTEHEVLHRLGAAISFAEKDRLLDYVARQQDPIRARELLAGFAESSELAATWVMGLFTSDELPEAVAAKMRGKIGNLVLKQPMMDIEQRIAARRLTDGNATKPREVLLAGLVANDVSRLLNEGRDWRYEFRHGVASLDEILGGMDGALNLTEEGRDAAHIALYRSLSEEDPAKALPLLDRLPEEKRREVMFTNTWESYGNINPDDFMTYLNQLPEPVTLKEKQDRMKGWDWKVRGLLQRHGDDYVEWVAALPSNPDKYAAINSIIWATREQNPAKADELNQRFYPK